MSKYGLDWPELSPDRPARLRDVVALWMFVVALRTLALPVALKLTVRSSRLLADQLAEGLHERIDAELNRRQGVE